MYTHSYLKKKGIKIYKDDKQILVSDDEYDYPQQETKIAIGEHLIDEEEWKEKSKKDEKKFKFHNILDGKTILVHAQANDEGHLFGGIGTKEIAEAILKRKKIEIDPKQINLPHRLKEIGKHDVIIKLGAADNIKFIVEIQREEK